MNATLLAAAFWLATATPWELQRVELRVEGRVNHVLARDLDGDGMAEVLAFTRQGTDEKPVRALAIWKVTREGVSAEPTWLLTLPDDTVVLDVCDVTTGPGAELVLLTTTGLSVWQRAPDGTWPRTPTPALDVPGILGFPDEEDTPFLSLCRAPAGAAGTELWVPTSRGISVVAAEAGGLRIDVNVPMRPRAYQQSGDEFRGPRARRDFAMLTQVVVPRLLSLDADHDGDDDLYQVAEDTVMLFPRVDGHLQPVPVMKRAFNTRNATDRARRNASLDVMLGDLNGDGLPDAVATKLTGGLTSLKTETRVFLGKGAAGFADEPIVVRRTDGYATPLGLLDVDGDGRQEMLEPVIKSSVMAVAGMLVRQRVDVDFRQLRVDGKALVESRAMGIPFALDTGTGGIKGGLPLTGQDVDGDGRPDLVNLGTGDRLEVLRGVNRDPPYDDESMWSARVPSTLRGEWYVPWSRGPAGVVLFFPDVKSAWGKVLFFRNPRMAAGPPPPR